MKKPILLIALLGMLPAAIAGGSGRTTNATAILPDGQAITPLAAPGATLVPLETELRSDGNADATGAMSTALSPDGSTLLVLTSGFNTEYYYPDGRPIRFPVRDPITGNVSNVTSPLTQWIFVYSVAPGGALNLVQRISIPDAFVGLAWAPDGARFYVSGGVDDRIVVYARRGNRFEFDPPAVVLGHNGNATAPLPDYDGGILARTEAGKRDAAGLGFTALAANVALSADGNTLAVANVQNDSISIVDTRSRRVIRERALYDVGSKTAQGEYPYGVAIRSRPGGALTYYVTSLRDGELLEWGPPTTNADAVDVYKVGGEPNALLLTPDGSKLFVANGDLDEIEEFEYDAGRGLYLGARISVDRPGQRYRGANPNALALDERTNRLYVTLGGENAVAVIDVRTRRVIGRIPTGWYPTSAAIYDGDHLAITDGKGLAPPNPGFLTLHMDAPDRGFNPTHKNEYILALQKANLLTMPIPSDDELATLTQTVDRNDGFGKPSTASPVIAGLRGKIKHVIYIMKENRTYDQVLGDLKGANGDPRIVVFPYPVTPNHHRLASQFVALDNFYTSGDVSSDGWNWSQQGRANEYTMRVVPLSYASQAIPGDFNGQNRGINTAEASSGGHDPFDARITSLLDPTGNSTILPGPKDVAATVGDSDDSPNVTGGYIWDSVLRAGKTVRHYGMYVDPTYYQIGAPFYIPVVRDAYSRGARQAPPCRPSLMQRTDLYYRGWDLNTPDRYRYEEWKREFDQYVKNGDLPAFESVELMMDHFGEFKTNVAGLDTPYLQIGDNDYAVGRLVEAVSHSRYWKDTAIFVLEDDSQAGPDHVSPHRSMGYVISAYTRRHAVVHTRYSTVTMLKTIEELLGIEPLGIYDANAPDMGDAFMAAPDLRDTYTAVIPGDLCKPPVHKDLIPECSSRSRQRTVARSPRRGAAWWIAKTAGMDFRRPDAVDPFRFNALLEKGLR